MGGLRVGVVEWNLLHQNPQLIKFRSLCTDFTDPKKSMESRSLWDGIWLRTLNIIFGISELSWNPTQNLTLQTGVVRCRRHTGKTAWKNQHMSSLLDGKTGMGDDPATGQNKLLQPHLSTHTTDSPLARHCWLNTELQTAATQRGTQSGSWGAVDPELN